MREKETVHERGGRRWAEAAFLVVRILIQGVVESGGRFLSPSLTSFRAPGAIPCLNKKREGGNGGEENKIPRGRPHFCCPCSRPWSSGPLISPVNSGLLVEAQQGYEIQFNHNLAAAFIKVFARVSFPRRIVAADGGFGRSSGF